jgi:hypothetical protein
MNAGVSGDGIVLSRASAKPGMRLPAHAWLRHANPRFLGLNPGVETPGYRHAAATRPSRKSVSRKATNRTQLDCNYSAARSPPYGFFRAFILWRFRDHLSARRSPSAGGSCYHALNYANEATARAVVGSCVGALSFIVTGGRGDAADRGGVGNAALLCGEVNALRLLGLGRQKSHRRGPGAASLNPSGRPSKRTQADDENGLFAEKTVSISNPHVRQIGSTSAAVQAVEILVQNVRGQNNVCECCKKSQGPGRTHLFREFLDRFAPSPEGEDDNRTLLYRTRSNLTHGFKPPFRIDWGFEWAMNTELNDQSMLLETAMQTVQIALRNWLADRRPSVKVYTKKPHVMVGVLAKSGQNVTLDPDGKINIAAQAQQ